VNRFPPLIFDPSDTIGSTVKIDSCQPDFYLVVEDLDGNAAALNPPTIEIRNVSFPAFHIHCYVTVQCNHIVFVIDYQNKSIGIVHNS